MLYGKPIILLLLFSFSLTAGQILFKYTADRVGPIQGWMDWLGLLKSWHFYSAVILYGFATLLWIYILQKTPLSFAYPFVALGFVLIPIFSLLLFNEQISLQYIAGVCLIVAGVYITSTA